MYFTYDDIGPASFIFNGEEYFYSRNAQGDVTGIFSEFGVQVATYTYDPWGRPTSDAMTTLGHYNPLRYRGYVYDAETGFYYLNSRYYNPTWGRFINADCLVDNRSASSQNLFAYCGNNPINNTDSSGDFWLVTAGIMAVGGVIGAVVSAVGSAISQKVTTGTVNLKSVLVAAATGFVSGAIAASPIGLIGQQILGGIIGGLSYVADCHINKRQAKLDEALASVGAGVISGKIGGPGANYNMALTKTIDSAKTAMAREARRQNREYAQKVIASATRTRNNTLALSAWSGSAKFSLGLGVSNGLVRGWQKLNLFPDALTW